jgi:hypothetical protein
VLAIPGGRGSCTASAVLIELLHRGCAPAAIILCEDELILPLGAQVAEAFLGCTLPVARIARTDFRALEGWSHAAVDHGRVIAFMGQPPSASGRAAEPALAPEARGVALSAEDEAMLSGAQGPARALAMGVILSMARLSGARELISVTRAHLDCCIHTGPASVLIAEQIASLGGRFAVPTTLNAVSADLRPGCPPSGDDGLVEASRRQARAYLAMCATESFTCAPYLRDGAPTLGEHIAWAESNAVLFANSVLGARTQKYPDYLDLCIALTGRAPLAGCHTDAGRRAETLITVTPPAGADDSFWPLLGYCAGQRAPHRIPVIDGVAGLTPGPDDLKAFAAAFATVSAAPIAHLAGITPEAPTVEAALGFQPAAERHRIDGADLAAAKAELDNAGVAVRLVALGNPHFSVAEITRLDALVGGRSKRPDVACVITTSRATLTQAAASGAVARLEAFGARFITDTCWCMLAEPVVGRSTGAVMTNSAKYAHYGPGLTGAAFRFGSLAACVEAMTEP